MIKIILVSHGNLGEELLRSAEMIVGNQTEVSTYSLEPDESLDTFTEKVTNDIQSDIDAGKEILVLVDLFGGTPSNAIAPLTRYGKASCLAGVNLPMLIEALLIRENTSVAKITSELLKAGKDSIVDIGEKIFGKNS
jgi:PTS system mannose-specific IIA component